MSLHFEGQRRIPLGPEHVAARLRDARFLVSCIPDAAAVGAATPDHAQCAVKPNIAFVRGNLDVDIRVSDSAQVGVINYAISSKGVGSSSTVEVRLQIAAAPEGTEVTWVADVKQLGGLLKMVPPGLIRGAAQKVIEEVWGSIERKM